MSQVIYLSLKIQFEVCDANSIKGFVFITNGKASAMLLYFLISSHCSSLRYFVLSGAKETRGHFLVSSVFIWVGGL